MHGDDEESKEVKRKEINKDPKGHELKYIAQRVLQRKDLKCSVCSVTVTKELVFHSCLLCVYDICCNCREHKERDEPFCYNKHYCVESWPLEDDQNQCNGCGKVK